MENFKKYLKESSTSFFLPIAFILAILPLIVRAKKVKLDEFSSHTFGKITSYDFFSQNKFLFLVICSIALVIILGVYFRKIFEKKDKIINIMLILSVIFLAFCLISSILSPYKHVSFFGVYNRAEGFITLTCYVLLFIYSVYTFKSTNDYKCLVIPILFIVFINAFLGIFQYAGNDLINTELGKAITVPRSVAEETGGQLKLLYDSGKLYGTLFHYNYVGSFVAVILPIIFCSMLIEDDIIYKIILAMGFISALWLLFGSTSRAGLVGVFVAILVGIIMFGRVIFKNKKQILIGLVSIAVIIVSLNFLTSGSVFKRVPLLFKDALSVFSNTSDVNYIDYIPVKGITNENGKSQIIFKNDTLNISFENNKYKFTNAKGEEIKIKKGEESYLFDNDAFSNVSFNLTKSSQSADIMDLIYITVDNKAAFPFRVKEDGTIHLVSATSLEDIDIESPETFGFAGKEKLGSSRGYIWSRSIPMLKDNILIGKGPDTFALEFPQNDLLAKYYAYDNPNTIVDKPHNLYLQIALNNGLIALIAFLGLMLVYIIDSFILYSLKQEYTKSQLFGTATSLGVIAYLFAGIFNDSIISVAPIFWILLGVGVAINYMNRKNSKA
ncbi:O-antigen ligase family protein [Clostridium neonatale]|uniref:O-antigen ligase family protein n=1 Tax=Clostridium neonatale TaxID=137838 RepID=UPI003D359294